jgi:hypothetical protein
VFDIVCFSCVLLLCAEPLFSCWAHSIDLYLYWVLVFLLHTILVPDSHYTLLVLAPTLVLAHRAEFIMLLGLSLCLVTREKQLRLRRPTKLQFLGVLLLSWKQSNRESRRSICILNEISLEDTCFVAFHFILLTLYLLLSSLFLLHYVSSTNNIH